MIATVTRSQSLRFVWGLAVGISLTIGFVPTVQAQPTSAAPVRLEIVMHRGIDQAVAHQFAETYAEAGVDMRMRSMRVGDDAQIQNVGTVERPSYLVTGFLTNDRRLLLPGADFGIRDAARVKQWMADLATRGPDAVVGETLAFGLTPAELLEVSDELATEVTLSTQGETIREVISRLSAEIRSRVAIDANAATALDDDLLCEDELMGLSVGTALAAAVRPAGLVLTVRKEESGRHSLAIVESRSTDEFWPIGWPVDRNPSVVAPILNDRIKVSITDFRLDQALAAIQAKIDLPMLIDRNSLAEVGVELDRTIVGYSHDSAPYGAILTRLLAQADPPLRYEVRLDENEKPFLWISPR